MAWPGRRVPRSLWVSVQRERAWGGQGSAARGPGGSGSGERESHCGRGGRRPPEGSPRRREASVADAMSGGSQTRSFVFSEPGGGGTAVALSGGGRPSARHGRRRRCVLSVDSSGGVVARRRLPAGLLSAGPGALSSVSSVSPPAAGVLGPPGSCWDRPGSWELQSGEPGPTQASLRARLGVGGRGKPSADGFGDSLAQRCLDLRKAKEAKFGGTN